MTETPQKAPSTKKQRQLIAIGCNQVGISAGMRHEMLFERFGVDSSTKLTRAQAYGFLAELKGRGFKVRPKMEPPRSRQGKKGAKRAAGAPVQTIVTRGELDKIQAVAGLIDWCFSDGLERWMQKRFGLGRVRTSHDAFRVIEGLKKMFENRMKKDFGPAWWVRVYDDPAIEIYKTEHCPERYVLRMMQARFKEIGEERGREENVRSRVCDAGFPSSPKPPE